MYLLLPLDPLSISSNEHWKIDWKAVDACSSVVEFLKNSFLRSHCNGHAGNPVPHNVESSIAECNAAKKIRFANDLIDIEALKNMVVLAIHTGRIYSIVEVVSNSSAESAFEENADKVPSDFSSYAEYFNKR